MTNEDKRTEISRIVREFTIQYVQDRLLKQLAHIIPGADQQPVVRHVLMTLYESGSDALQYTLEPQQWLTMALYGAGEIDEDSGEIHEICQSMAEWLFALPNHARYEIPRQWAETDMGALWWQAIIRAQGDEMITIAQAAELAGVTVQAISQRISAGKLTGYINPLANERQGRRLVRRSDVAGGAHAVDHD